jgi:hypothetical protein
MTRATVALFAIALVACDASQSPTVPGGTASLANGGQQVTGAGNFSRPFSDGHFTVSAHSDADGSVRGNASITAVQTGPFQNFDVQGPVTCLAVAGNRAAVGIKVKKGSFGGTDIAGLGIVLLVEDNGSPGHGVPDGVTNSGFYGDGDNIPCAAELAGTPFPVVSGNIVIK